jgi:putative endonuclease
MWFVYIIVSQKDNIHYSGISQDVSKRLDRQNNEKNRFTKGYMPWILLYLEPFHNAADARKREKYFKSGVGRKFIKTMVKNCAGSPPDR